MAGKRVEARISYPAIALISAAALAYELLLIRLFSFIQWYHFAYMIISLALLGYGASGTFISLFQKRWLAHYPRVFVANVFAFALAMVVCYQLAQSLPLNGEEIIWDSWQWLWLMLIYLLLSLPFFFAANCIALTFSAQRLQVGRIYAMDLLGAGAGSLGIIVLLFYVPPMLALSCVSAAAFIAGAFAIWQMYADRRIVTIVPLLCVAVALFMPSQWLKMTPSPYKPLSQALAIEGTEVVGQYSNPLGILTVVASPKVPWRFAPGLSLNAPVDLPDQLAVFSDGAAMTVVTRYGGDREALRYLDYMTSALPYHLASPKRVLILDAGAGGEVLQARYHRVAHIDAADVDGRWELLAKKVYRPDDVQFHVSDGRGYLASTNSLYDLIEPAFLEGSAVATAPHALNENYLYTVEAFQAYLNHLSTDGYLAVTGWVELPPRSMLKMAATAVEALRRNGVADAGRYIILIRSWQTITLLVKKVPVSDDDIAALKRFCRERGFDLGYYPGMEAAEANHHNILSSPDYFNGMLALTGAERRQFVSAYKFDLEPPTDDRPYFSHFFKWTALDELLSLQRRGGASLVEWGYLILVATLVQALVASVLMIVVPLVRRRSVNRVYMVRHAPVFLYFSTIGLAFLFVEIAFIQRFILFLHHPLYAVAVVVAAFLIFAGLGSRYCQYVVERCNGQFSVFKAAMGIAALSLIYLFSLESLFNTMGAWALWARVVASLILIAPLAFCMGMPFPAAMAHLGRVEPELMPWAWGINGCASVISAVLATLIAVALGFSAVIKLAVMLYLAAAWFYIGFGDASANEGRDGDSAAIEPNH